LSGLLGLAAGVMTTGAAKRSRLLLLLLLKVMSVTTVADWAAYVTAHVT
jgi:hypothetical protein